MLITGKLYPTITIEKHNQKNLDPKSAFEVEAFLGADEVAS